MGCCPSKQQNPATDDAQYVNQKTEKAVVTTLEVGRETVIMRYGPPSNQQEEANAPTDMLMDRGDGRPRIKSDHVGEPAMESEVVIDMDGMDVVPVAEPEEVDSIQQQEQEPSPAVSPTTSDRVNEDLAFDVVRKPTRPQSMSEVDAIPFVAKKPARPHSLSYDDIPIDSMYHRLRVQKMEEEEAARQAELRREAELREKEIQEFKAAMARS